MDFFIWAGLFLIVLYALGRGSSYPKKSNIDYSAIVAGLVVGLFVSLFPGANKPYKN